MTVFLTISRDKFKNTHMAPLREVHYIIPIVFKMKSYIVIVWLLSVSHAQLQNSVEDCTVFEQKSGELKKCEDVFVYENQTYYGCTTEDSENGEAWCSTKVDPRTYEHINGTGFFGYCRKSKCMMAEKGKKEQDRMMALQEGKGVSVCELRVVFVAIH